MPAAATAPSPGPSFDCARAGTRVERAICADADLAAADRRLADLYRRQLATGDAAQLRRDQQDWLRQRNRCESEPNGGSRLRDCIATAIAQRTAVLEPPAPRRPAAVPFAYPAWEVTVTGERCAVARMGPRGRRLAIERDRSAPGDAAGVLRFIPGPDDRDLVRPGERVVFLADQQRIAAIVRDGDIFGAPGQEAAAAQAVAQARTLTVVRMLDSLLEVPLDGLGPALAEMRARCRD